MNTQTLTRAAAQPQPFVLNAVILNGAKRNDGSLTEARAEAVGVIARASHQTASAHVESAILHYVRVADSRTPFRMTTVGTGEHTASNHASPFRTSHP